MPLPNARYHTEGSPIKPLRIAQRQSARLYMAALLSDYQHERIENVLAKEFGWRPWGPVKREYRCDRVRMSVVPERQEKVDLKTILPSSQPDKGKFSKFQSLSLRSLQNWETLNGTSHAAQTVGLHKTRVTGFRVSLWSIFFFLERKKKMHTRR